MADEKFEFNTPDNQTVARKLFISYLNTGTHSAPVWSPLGKRTEDSSIEYDWGEETSQDILGNTWTNAKTPVKTQSFDPLPLDASDAAVNKIHDLAIIKEDAQAITNQDMLIVHWYLNAAGETVKHFAVRHTACMVKPSSLGGEGGGNLGMPTDVTYGGTRTVGTATKDDSGVVTFTPDGAATTSAASYKSTTSKGE